MTLLLPRAPDQTRTKVKAGPDVHQNMSAVPVARGTGECAEVVLKRPLKMNNLDQYGSSLWETASSMTRIDSKQ